MRDLQKKKTTSTQHAQRKKRKTWKNKINFENVKTRYRSSTEAIKQTTPPTKNGHGGVLSDETWFRVALYGCVSVSISVPLSFTFRYAVMFFIYSKPADTVIGDFFNWKTAIPVM